MEKIALEKTEIQSKSDTRETNRIVEVEKFNFEATQESSLRPSVWEEYI